MNQALAVVADPVFPELKAFVIERTGLVYFRDKDADLAHRLSRRFEALQIQACSDYLARLRTGGDAEEFDRLVTELTIGETYFFRHQEQFDALTSIVIPAIIERNRAQRRLRVWCAGCSIGAEPYTVAILLADRFALELAGWDVKIVGTDLNRDFLQRARRGHFEEWSFRTTAPALRQKHFVPSGKGWEVRDEIKAMVDFQHHNLLHPLGVTSGGGPFDLIFCRNVMIYFDWPTVARVMPTFEANLAERGWLVIGHAEQPHGATALEALHLPDVTIYRKVSIRPAVAEAPPAPVIVAASKPPVAIESAAIAGLRSLADRGLFPEVLAECGRLIELNPLDPRPYFYRALVNDQLRRPAEVEPDLERAIDLDQSFVMAHYLLALHRRATRDPRGATRSFHRALFLLGQMKPDQPLPEADQLTVAELKTVITNYVEAA